MNELRNYLTKIGCYRNEVGIMDRSDRVDNDKKKYNKRALNKTKWKKTIKKTDG